MTWSIRSTAGRHRGSLYECMCWLSDHHGNYPRLLGPEGQKIRLGCRPWCNRPDSPDWDENADITPGQLAEELISELESQPHG